MFGGSAHPFASKSSCFSRPRLQAAWDVCLKSAGKAGSNHPIWSLAHNWECAQTELLESLRGGDYRISPIKQWTPRHSSVRPASQYAAEDVVVLKALALWLDTQLAATLSVRCTHLKGNGGVKGAVRQIDAAIRSGKYRYVFRSDVKGYYDSINTDLLLDMLKARISDQTAINVLYQYMHRCVVKDGHFKCVNTGIPLGCSLSPLMAALYLDRLDRSMESLETKGIFYVRFMDDWVILAPTRAKFRLAIRIVNEVLAALGLEKHPDKTFIGKLSRGFEALGYCFADKQGIVGPSTISIRRFADRIFERQARHEGRESLQRYVTHWLSWCCGGLDFCLRGQRYTNNEYKRERRSASTEPKEHGYHETNYKKSIQNVAGRCCCGTGRNFGCARGD